MRLFVAVELPGEARRAVAALERPAGGDVRWTDPSTWHVTLRFLGEVDGDEAARAALAAVDAGPAVAVVGRVPERLGPTAVVLPVAGLDAVAAAVAAAFADLPGEAGRPFTGHLTVGRLRRPGRWPAGGIGALPAEVSWPVRSIALVRSHLVHGAPPRHEVLARQALGPPAGGTVAGA